MLSPDSLLGLSFVSDPQVSLSPTGTRVAYVVTRIVDEACGEGGVPPRPRYHSAVWLSEGEARPLTSGEARDSAPRLAPDGRSLAFLSDRSGKAQLYLLPLEGGEARQLTRYAQGVANPLWSPDGRYLAFLSRGDGPEEPMGRGEARVITHPRYKFNGQHFLPDEPAQLYLLEVATGELRQLTDHAAEISDVQWLPGSDALLFVAAADRHREALWQTEAWRVDLSGTVTQVTCWNSAISSLAPHPGGQGFAAVARPEDRGNTEDPHLYLFGWDGSARRLDTAFDYPAGNLVSSDVHVGAYPTRPVWRGEALLSLYTVGGSAGLFEVPLDGSDVRPLVFNVGRSISAFSAQGEMIAFLEETPHELPEVYLCELPGRKVTPLTRQANLILEWPEVELETLRVGQVEGWVMRPRELAEDARLPVFLTIHGGPHTAYGYGFMHEFRLLVACGYAVAYCNPRGSVGYGQAFSSAIYGRWGTVDYEDLMAFYDELVRSRPWIDASRAAVGGGSYGGYMTNWIIGHTDRFRAAITDRSICNLISFNGSSDIGARFWTDELGLEAWRSEDIEALWHMSPLKYVERVKTPTLIVHSERDHRCPVEQAEQWFMALYRLGVEVRFVRFPEEDHELSRSGRPDRRLMRLSEMLAWLDRHLVANAQPLD
ncbi:dipeptidyl aminopeptidase/acylaminoacyl peptidase [Deinobacterium chartae]|uniref:Dipeptidyl aminopeptidase/acylaminoacyl peptidase n=1 Tax=Deinobacterium chartae TaxID=521158 RepID=A0A841I4X8_9DEIO|nr:S9 family peptidase [Deinobacterium chartae]MBB6099480.1 dipeptidyl aminopeptidase/acylaminoacyl peptidase [Deinobacterium chartae]